MRFLMVDFFFTSSAFSGAQRFRGSIPQLGFVVQATDYGVYHRLALAIERVLKARMIHFSAPTRR